MKASLLEMQLLWSQFVPVVLEVRDHVDDVLLGVAEVRRRGEVVQHYRVEVERNRCVSFAAVAADVSLPLVDRDESLPLVPIFGNPDELRPRLAGAAGSACRLGLALEDCFVGERQEDVEQGRGLTAEIIFAHHKGSSSI
eukprot:CAMPEP_0168322474 /NCGR_PEP_ID=MMETSP0213-20121227/2906_1 /TAXON_ID=151035 /ORGANISM="Euplotes harpa, Strain FSP1.4" /LENGTH=139 /DNA_ID=CAMNT_0008324359 /DNA_START=209 /DNA_END=628 /DNA_ORIENTATION=-